MGGGLPVDAGGLKLRLGDRVLGQALWLDPGAGAAILRIVELSRVPSLGELVVQRGLLSEDELEVALAEHFASGRRLGEILVERGHIDAGELTQMLDEQHRLRSAEPGADGATRGIDLLREQLEAAEAELTRHLPPRASAESTEPAEPAVETEQEAAPEHDAPAENTYVLFIPAASGYQLLERIGPLPEVGDEIGVSGGQLLVAKVGASPLPGDHRRCAYLEAP